ncbi:hypothetical protein [Methylocystis echinoides]|uniref:Uncharacterized protein n=1 Tax=Methylocystis echinoides TaxID=29468 RepID=A0A9W6GUU3_9HYPH|nr:hypothetical protein [Methylocystis echinoides]GLI93348.1 hypothetical protein LMG27198_23400 [Methylocystis echinoides]
MATKPDFTAPQWEKIVESPLLAGFAVSAAAPSGLIGTLLESMASADALAAARTDATANTLVRAVVDDLLTPERRMAARESVQRLIEGADLPEIKTRALAQLQMTAGILDASAPLDAAAFKGWLAEIAARVAAAATEGGVLGFGGEKISAAERAALAELDAVLGRGSGP